MSSLFEYPDEPFTADTLADEKTLAEVAAILKLLHRMWSPITSWQEVPLLCHHHISTPAHITLAIHVVSSIITASL